MPGANSGMLNLGHLTAATDHGSLLNGFKERFRETSHRERRNLVNSQLEVGELVRQLGLEDELKAFFYANKALVGAGDNARLAEALGYFLLRHQATAVPPAAGNMASAAPAPAPAATATSEPPQVSTPTPPAASAAPTDDHPAPASAAAETTRPEAPPPTRVEPKAPPAPRGSGFGSMMRGSRSKVT